MNNLLKLYSGHLRNSKRVLLIASIGLICALTIVSSTNYYLDNSKAIIAQNYFSLNASNNEADTKFSLTSSLGTYNESLKTIHYDIDSAKTKDGINFFKKVVVNSSLVGFFLPTTRNITLGTSIITHGNSTASVVELTNPYFQELSQINQNKNNTMMPGSLLPNEKSGALDVFILFINDFTHSWLNTNVSLPLANDNSTNLFDTGTNTAVKINVVGSATVNLNNYVCDISGIHCQKSTNYDHYTELKLLAHQFQSSGSQIIIFTKNLSKFTSVFLSKIEQNPNLNPNTNILNLASVGYHFSISIFFDYSKIDPFSVNSITSTIDSFIQTVTGKFYNNYDFQYITSSFVSKNLFLELGNEIASLKYAYLIVSLPMLLSTIFVINYSFGLINKNIILHFGIFKTRGTTPWMLFFFQILDNILIILLSIVVALVTGIPISTLILRSDNFLSFNYKAPSDIILNFVPVSILLLYVSIIIIILVNFRRIIKFSQMSIPDTDKPIEREEPYWKKHYIDVLLFVLGIIIYMSYIDLVRNPNTAVSISPLIFVLTSLILPGLLGFLIGLILLITRIVPEILDRIGSVLWNRKGNLLAFSFKNIARHRKESARAVVLLSIILAFLVLFYSIPFTTPNNELTNAQFDQGAEGKAHFINGYNETSMALIETNFSKYVTVSPYIVLSTATGSYKNNFIIMLVNTSTYLQTAFLNFDLGLSKNIHTDFYQLQFLKNSSTNPSLNILLNKYELNQRGLSIGQSMNIGQNFVQNQWHFGITLNIVDSFNSWPMLTASYPFDGLAIGDISYYLGALHKTLVSSPFPILIDMGILFKFKDGVNEPLISNWIEGNTSISNINLISNSRVQFINGLFSRLQLGQINNDVIMGIFISMIVLIMFSYLQLNGRKKEIFTERAIGMKLHQIISLFFIETMILTLTGLILGIGIGIFLIQTFTAIVFNPLQTSQFIQTAYPFNVLKNTILIILTGSIFISFIPAIYVRTHDISQFFGEQ